MKKVLLLVLLLFIFIPIKVFAYNDSFYEGEYIPDAYIKKFKGNSGKYEQMRVLRRKSDNRIVYCLELWENIKTGVNMEGYNNWQHEYLNIKENIWQEIVRISYYGYGYINHNSLNWYAATQYMIWQLLSPESNIYFTDTLNGNKVDKFKNEIDEIKRLRNEHFILPTLPIEKEFLYNKEYTFMDTNNVLEKYEISTAPGIKYTKQKNVLKITNTRKERTAFKLYKEDKLYNNDPIVYINNSGQNLLLPGSYPPVIKTSYFSIKTTDIIINKKDLDTNLSVPRGDASFKDIVFELYDEKNNLVATEKINNLGQVIFKNIGYGQYFIKEINPGIGYTLNDIGEDIYVDEDNTIFDYYNEVIKNKIVIKKSIKNLDGTEELEKAKFIVLDSNNNEVLNFETNDGFYSFELPYGNYLLRQLTGKENYKFIDDIIIKVEEDNIVQEYSLYDEEIPREKEIEIKEEKDNITDQIVKEYVDVIEDVPNTYKGSGTSMIEILIINIGLVYLKGKKNA